VFLSNSLLTSSVACARPPPPSNQSWYSKVTSSQKAWVQALS
jgi:hypothetical protein